MGGTICNFATQLKFLLNYDDALDIFAVHTIGGIVGNVCLALLTDSSPILIAHRLPLLGANGDLRTEIRCRL